MKKLFLILLFAFLRFSAVPLFFLAGCIFTSSSNSQWVQQQIPTGQLVQDIHFLDSLHGWLACSNGAVNDSGVILYTSTGGTSWVRQYEVNSSPLYGIRMANLSTGYCVGGFRKILKTTNSGQNWLNTNITVGAYFLDVKVINPDILYVCVEDSPFQGILKSTDGGNTYNIQFTSNCRKLFFINNQTGWAITSSFNLRRTTNGGTNWNLVYNSTNSIAEIFFIDENTGWMFNAGFFKSTNGGNNWFTQTLPAGSTGGEIQMITPTYGYIGGRFNKINKTLDGTNWIIQDIPIFNGYQVSFVDSLIGWCGTSGLAKTTNGGIMALTQITNIGPKEFSLYQNYPNPFNPATNIKFDISESSVIKLYISDILGRVHYEVINQYLVPGKYEFNWDSRGYSSGVYFYTLISDKFTETKKMLLVK